MVVTADPIARIEATPGLWAYTVLPSYMRDPVTQETRDFAPHHYELLAYIWQVDIGRVPVINGRTRSSYVACWARGGAKTTLAQICIAALAARGRRRYALYVCGTQDKADEKVTGVGDMLTSPRFRAFYPEVGARRVNAYGQGAWRRNRIQTGAFTLDGIGLDAAVRGAKVDEDRPDLIIFDDIDDTHDSPWETQKKVETITKAIIPAGQIGNTIILFVQNVIIEGGVMAQLLGDADWLNDRIISGPIPALRGMRVEAEDRGDGRTHWKIVAGTPTWPGQSLAENQGLLDQIGLEAFRTEAQHDLRAASPLVFPHFRVERHRYLRSRQSIDSDGIPTLVPELPPFVAFAGGLDWGGEGATAHLSAGIVIGITRDGRYIIVDEFAERGQNIGRRQLNWMMEMQLKWGTLAPLRWRGDGSQGRATDWGRELGFDIQAGDREPNSAETRRSLLADALVPDGVDPRKPPEEWPASTTPRLTYVPRCQAFEREMLRYRRKVPRTAEEPARREVVKVNDDVIDATMQALEEAARGTWRSDGEMTVYDSVRM